jgi:hypothetical protein
VGVLRVLRRSASSSPTSTSRVCSLTHSSSRRVLRGVCGPHGVPRVAVHVGPVFAAVGSRHPRRVSHLGVTLRARWVTLRARWVTLRGSLGDAKSSLGDAKSSLGDAKSFLGDAESSLGDSKS